MSADLDLRVYLVTSGIDDRTVEVAARAADIYGRVAQEMAAQDAVLDHLKGQGDG